MAYVTTPIPDNERLRAVGHDLLEASWGQTLGASAEGALAEGLTYGGVLPLVTLSQGIDTAKATFTAEDPWAAFDLNRPGPSPKLSTDEWRQSAYYRKGLSFPDGVQSDVAAILADRYDARERRQDIQSRAPKSWAMYPAQLAVALGTSLLDPLNDAAAFVPVVGEARYAGMIQKLGKVGAWAAKGAAEGAAGAAMMEPLLYAGQKVVQNEDYTLTDSLVNVGFGALFGSGLHILTGAAGEVLGRYAVNTRVQMLKAAIAQVADGEPANVELLHRIAEATGEAPPVNPRLDAGAPPDAVQVSAEAARLTDADVPRADLDHAMKSHDEVMATVEDLKNAGQLSNEHVQVLIEGDAVIKAADTYERILKAVSACISRRG